MNTITGTDIQLAASFLREGKLIGMPTETVYGLAGNALSESAVLNIFKTKDRPEFDPLIVHVKSLNEVGKYTTSVPDQISRLMQRFWPGPLTVLLPKNQLIPDLVTSGLDTVALRMPAHPIALKLLEILDFPLAAPSANPFGYISPTTALHVYDQLQGKLPYILDGGPCSVGVESTILGMEAERPVIFRVGGLSVDAIESVIGKVEIQSNISSNPRAPGMLKSHYAPSKPMFFNEMEHIAKLSLKGKGALICFDRMDTSLPLSHFPLSENGDLEEAARNLFATLRMLDKSDFDYICAVPFPDKGLGKAINDRLRRAGNQELRIKN